MFCFAVPYQRNTNIIRFCRYYVLFKSRTSPVQPQKFCNFIAMEHFIYPAVLLMMGKMEIMCIGSLNSTQRVFLAFIPDLRQYSPSLVRF